MGFLVVLIAMVAALVDYAFKAEASARFESSEDLITFFAGFYATVGVLTFAVQTALGPRMLQRFGIGTTIAVLPADQDGAEYGHMQIQHHCRDLWGH